MAELSAIKIVILLFSVVLHEVMHGVMALKFGDSTAQRAGRLTLNPIPHIDPIGTILIPGFLLITGSPIFFGWAKPVPVNPLNFSDLRKGELFVSAAGILANLFLAIVGAVLFNLLRGTATPDLLLQSLTFVVIINLLLGIFNLFPIPPLDGSKVLLSLLPYNLARQYERLEPYGFLILVILLMSGFLQPLLSFAVSTLFRILIP